MQRLLSLSTLLLLVISLSACNEAADVHVVAPAAPATPQLQEFEVIDSFGYSSGHSRVHVAELDPEINGGLFEIYWLADSYYDYWVTVSINDRPSMANSIILSEELCGYNYSCDYDGMQWCTYSSDFFMGCGADLHEMDRNMTDIVDLVWELPEYLYLNIEVCDERGLECQVSSREVALY